MFLVSPSRLCRRLIVCFIPTRISKHSPNALRLPAFCPILSWLLWLWFPPCYGSPEHLPDACVMLLTYRSVTLVGRLEQTRTGRFELKTSREDSISFISRDHQPCVLHAVGQGHCGQCCSSKCQDLVAHMQVHTGGAASMQ
jgi:hypothetical protein